MDNGVSQLGAAVVESGVDPAVDDDTAAYAGSEGDYDNVPAALASAREDLAERRRVSVVFNV